MKSIVTISILAVALFALAQEVVRVQCPNPDCKKLVIVEPYLRTVTLTNVLENVTDKQIQTGVEAKANLATEKIANTKREIIGTFYACPVCAKLFSEFQTNTISRPIVDRSTNSVAVSSNVVIIR